MITRDKLEQRIAALEMASRDSTTATVAVENFIAPCYLPLHEDIKAGRHRFYQSSGRAWELQKLFHIVGDRRRHTERPYREKQRHCVSQGGGDDAR